MRYQPLEAPSSTPQRSVLESTCPAEDPFRSATRRTKAMDFESWFEMAKAQVQRLEDEKDGVATARRALARQRRLRPVSAPGKSQSTARRPNPAAATPAAPRRIFEPDVARARALGFALPSSDRKARAKRRTPLPRPLRAQSGDVVRSVLRGDLWHDRDGAPATLKDQWLVTVHARRSGGFEVKAYHPATSTEASMRLSEVEATLSFDLAISSLRHWAANTLPFMVELYYRDDDSAVPRLRCKRGVAKQRTRRPSTAM
jgi:hypothetical protein